ncbi:S-layer domain protein [Paenibacillus curdlanolyticus YK9]|uniref:S-layer domain protein n=1 Tax=Paenibacillus curdlanolyticus YK9 TaxID=717606 RepID=E0IGN2_9BACL|nr:YcdB/YcdC domain-containing protein [Paenibacillus curdlanolyticus]EFM08370.1 S-layer domain protein [Paenibacillus curdlanolyticus YK9]
MTMKKNKKPRVSSASRKLIALATMVALTASLPTAAFADKAVNPSVVSGAPSTAAATSSDSAASQPASGDDASVKAEITKAKAIELARKYLSIPDAYTLQSSRLSTNMQENGLYIVWNLSFINKVNGKVKGTIEAGLDGTTGELLSYYSSTDNSNAKPSYPPKVNREKATGVALAFLNKIRARLREAS